jgi:hypothetical protein
MPNVKLYNATCVEGTVVILPDHFGTSSNASQRLREDRRFDHQA